MKLKPLPNDELAILTRVVEPTEPNFSAVVAETILAMKFGEADVERMNELAAKARDGTLTAKETTEAEAYGRVSSWLGIMKSKARLSLKKKQTRIVKAK